MTTETHIIKEEAPLGDIITSLKALIAAGRGGELVEFEKRPEGHQLTGGSVQFVYPLLLQFARERVRKSIEGAAEKIAAAKSMIREQPATVEAFLRKALTEAEDLRRELAPSGEFAAEEDLLVEQICAAGEMLDDLTTGVREPDPQDTGAGKLRVLDERRLARDPETQIRDYPLREKLARKLGQQVAQADAGMEGEVDREAYHATNQDFKEMIKTMTGKPLIKAVEDILDGEFPELMKAFYPRVYESTGRYHSPRSMAAMMANVVAEMLRYGYHRSATAYRLLMPGLAYLKERRMPMFFLAPDLLEAVLRTDFDDDIDWRASHLELPYETGVLILPKGALVHPTDGEVAMLMWSRVPKGDNPSPWPGIPMSVLPNDVFIIMGACPQTMIWYDSILTADKRPTTRLRNLFYRAPGESAPAIKKSNFMDEDLSEGDAEFVEKMGVVVFGTILAMDARPQLVEHGKLIKRVGKAEKLREFWSPNVIGAKYKLKREVARISERQFVATKRAHGGGTHASPRMHWRRGHHRDQPVGPGRKERKHIWIEPILIGAEA